MEEFHFQTYINLFLTYKMIKKLHIKSNLVIGILAVLSILSYLVVENTMSLQKLDYFQDKIEASKTTKKAMRIIKNHRLKNVVFIDKINDPNETGIIGQRHSQITTGSGSLPVKLSTINPNFSGVVVQLLKDAKVKEGDHIAVCMTGSFPALDIATLIAIEQLKIKPILIASTTSSSWGANDPNYTILDMVTTLQKADILKLTYQYASIGGNQDIGMSLSNKGRELIKQAIERNHLKLLNKDDLLLNIKERMRIIDHDRGNNPIKAFINIGGGIASLGSNANKKKLKAGLSKKIKLKDFPDKYGVAYEMAVREVPIINLANVSELMRKFDLPKNPVPLPEIGDGKLYYALRYNLPIVATATLFLFSMIGLFVYIDKRNNELGNDIISTEIEV